jgi:hypothetical protein
LRFNTLNIAISYGIRSITSEIFIIDKFGYEIYHIKEEEPKDEEGDNQKEGDAKPSTVTPVVKEPPRELMPKAPYLERLQAPRNG